MYITRDASAITGGSYTSSVISGVSVNTGATSVDTAKLRQVIKRPVQANITEVIDNPNHTIRFFLVHGDYIVVTGTGATANMEVTLELGVDI